MKLAWLVTHQAVQTQVIAEQIIVLVMPTFAPSVPLEPPVQRWKRMCLRMAQRNLWHWKGILLWIVQRPFLKALPLPLPSMSSVDDWIQQGKDMVERGSWPKRWFLEAKPKFNLVNMKECISMRQKLGLRLAFIEDEVCIRGLQGFINKNDRKKIQQATVVETRKLLQLSEERQQLQLRALLGPRGGLPRLKDELVKVAILMHVEVTTDDTVETLRQKLKEPVAVLTTAPTWNNQVPSQPSSKASGPAPPPPVDTRSTSQQPQRLTNQHLQVQQRGELPGAGGYNREGSDEVLTIHSNEDGWEAAAEVEEMETDFHQLAENQD